MKLMNESVKKALNRVMPGSTRGTGTKVIVKYFNPVGPGTWLITEGRELDDGDWELYGWAEIGHGYEAGYVLLSELENVRLPFGMRIERELYTRPGRFTVRELMAA